MQVSNSMRLLIALNFVQELKDRAKTAGGNKRELYFNVESPHEGVVQFGVFLLDVSDPQADPPPILAEFFLAFVPSAHPGSEMTSIQVLGRRKNQEQRAAYSLHGDKTGYIKFAQELAPKALVFLTRGEWFEQKEGLTTYGDPPGGPNVH